MACEADTSKLQWPWLVVYHASGHVECVQLRFAQNVLHQWTAFQVQSFFGSTVRLHMGAGAPWILSQVVGSEPETKLLKHPKGPVSTSQMSAQVLPSVLRCGGALGAPPSSQ